MADRLWVAELRISAAIAQKINAIHNVTEDEVRDLLVCQSGLFWVRRPADDGLEVQLWIRGVEHLAVIFPKWRPDPDDVYYLATVYARRTK